MWLSPRVNLSRSFDYDARDIAVAFIKVITSRYGKDSIGNTKENWFWQIPRNLVSVEIGYNEKINVIFGQVKVKSGSFSADFFVCPFNIDGHKTAQITCLTSAKNQKEAEIVLEEIQKHLNENSISRGKAIDASGHFLDLSGVNLDKVFYNEATGQSLQTHIWTIIEQPERCAEARIKRQRKVLLAGPYGAGKTITGMITAKKAIANGWTFIYLPPTHSQDLLAIHQTLDFAKKYPPATVFIEDLDEEQKAEDSYALRKIQEATDGLISKNQEIILVMSTVRADKIDGALQRPGRIDKIIPLGILSASDIQRSLILAIENSFLDKNINWEEVAKSCLNYPPAFIHEIATNALLCMVSEGRETITTELLVRAAKDLQSQFKACESKLGFNPAGK